MKYILKAALLLAVANTAIAGNFSNYTNSFSRQTLGDFSTKAFEASKNALNTVKTQATPYVTQAVTSAKNQADSAFGYVTSGAFKKDGERALAIIQTPAGKLVVAGTIATLATGYGLYKYLTAKKSDRK